MTVVVKNPEDNSILVLSKGADSILFPLLKPAVTAEEKRIREDTNNQLRTFAQVGLRTLILCEKRMDEASYRKWAKTYSRATGSIDDREAKIADAVKELECDFELTGATAIEDRLQDQVGETIAAVKEAGIAFWMLTGDKIDTAINIGFSAKLLDQGVHILRLEQRSKRELMDSVSDALDIIEKKGSSSVATVVEGESFFKIQQS